MPVRSRGAVTWTAPADEPQAVTWGWCADHYLTDIRATGAQRDLAEPPTPGELYWRQADTDDLLLVPELRGAIQRPRTHPMGLGEVTPCDQAGAALAWGAASDWWQQTHETMRQQVALYQPPGTVGTGYLRTTDQLAAGQGFIVWYKLLSASDVDADQVPVQRGIALHLGLAGGQWHYRLHCPDPHRDDASGGWWTLQRRTSTGAVEVADRIPAPSAPHETQAEPSPEWLLVIPAVGRLLVRSSRSQEWWVHTRPGGCWPRAGQLGVGVTGGRAWVLYGTVDYADTCVIAGPSRTLPEEVTEAGEARIAALTTVVGGVPDCAYNGQLVDDGERRCHPVITIVNSSPQLTYTPSGRTGRLRTPIIYTLQEVHRTALGVGAGGAPVDLTADVESLSVTYQEEGRGTVASLRLRNWREAAGGGYDLGHLDDVLRGIGRVTIDLAHEYANDAPDGPTVRVLTGWLARVTWGRDDMWPTVELECDDRAWLWADGRATMYDLPDVTGWDLREAAELLLTHWEVPATDLVWPDTYPADGWRIPWQEGSAAGRFSEDTDIAEALDTLCERCAMRWRVRPDGRIEFRWHPAAGTPAFTLDQATVTPEDRVELPTAVVVDHNGLRNVVRVRGRTSWGDEVESRYVHGPSRSTPASPVYLGRAVHLCRSEPENPEPSRTAARLLAEQTVGGRELTWRSIGRDLWPGDLVEVRVDHLGVVSGTRFRLTGVTLSWSAEDPLWRGEYTGRIVAGGVS